MRVKHLKEYFKRRFFPNDGLFKWCGDVQHTSAMMMATAECCFSVTNDGRTERVLILNGELCATKHASNGAQWYSTDANA